MNYRIGVDGGATKTAGILVDETGQVVARHQGPGSNPSVAGSEEAGRVAGAVLDELRGQAGGPIGATLLCMAGAAGFWEEFAGRQKDLGRVVATSDAAPILELAAPDGPGLVLHAGTGSFVAARTAQDWSRVHYAGGLGWRFGDEGSGYDLGRRVVARALLELQGWAPPSPLVALVQAHTGLADAGAITRHFYGEASPNAQIAALTPEVLRLAGAGDPVALALVLDSADGLLRLAVLLVEKIFAGAPVHALRAGLSGPILTHPAILPELQARCILPLRAVEGTPTEGVRRLLLRLG
jgi:glucosamine kinase